MFLKSKDSLVGLDIGSSTIKAAELSNTKAGYILKKACIIDIASGAIEEGMIKNVEVVSGSIKELFKAYNIKEHNVAVSIGGYSVIVKKINVQKMTEIELQNTIQFEAEQYIPFDINDVNLDFQILGENDQNPNQMSVMLVAAKREMINDYINLLHISGLNPCVLDIDAFALQNIYELNYIPKEEENVALIDVGESKTSINFLKGNMSIFMRDVSQGCGQIIQKIVDKTKCSIEEAKNIRISGQTDKLKPEELREIESSVVAEWCIEINRALEFYHSTYSESQIEKIYLSGGGATNEEFKQLLAAETSIEVMIIDPFINILLDDKYVDTSYIKKIAPQMAICLGLAIRKLDDK